MTLLGGQSSPSTGNGGLDRGRLVPDVTPRTEDPGLLTPYIPFPGVGVLFLHSLLMRLVAQVRCFKLPSLGKSAEVPQPKRG